MKKITALLLALVMALSLVACGDKTPAENGGGGSVGRHKDRISRGIGVCSIRSRCCSLVMTCAGMKAPPVLRFLQYSTNFCEFQAV